MSLFDTPPSPRVRHTHADTILAAGGALKAAVGACGASGRDVAVTALPALVTCPACAATAAAPEPSPRVERRTLCYACSQPATTDGFCATHAAVARRATEPPDPSVSTP